MRSAAANKTRLPDPIPRIPCFRPVLGDEETEAIARVLDSRWLSVGGVTREFEERLQDYLDVPHVIAVASGTAALHLALLAIDLSDGDEVIVPSLTFVSAIQMTLAAGARPVFCDVVENTLNMDPDDAASRITPRTRAILPVHLGGYPCEIDRLTEIAEAHSIVLIEDAAHAFGSSYAGRKIGSSGDLTCFSFSPVKNITCGEGGAVATANPDYARNLRTASNLGISKSAWSRLGSAGHWSFSIDGPGFRYAMPNLNAAIGLTQLERVERLRNRKLRVKQLYDDAFSSHPGVRLYHTDSADIFPYSYTIRVTADRRDALIEHLRLKGIGTAVHYPPNHLQPHFRAGRVSLPVTERVCREVLCLPLHASMTDAETMEVVTAVSEFMGPAE